MKTIYLDDFLSDCIIKEDDFRQKVSEVKWEQYENEKVLIKEFGFLNKMLLY